MATMLHPIRAPDFYKELVEGDNIIFSKEDLKARLGYCADITYIRIHNLEDRKGIVKLYYVHGNKPILTAFLDNYGIFEMPLQFPPTYEHPLLRIWESINAYSEIKGTINIVYYWR